MREKVLAVVFVLCWSAAGASWAAAPAQHDDPSEKRTPVDSARLAGKTLSEALHELRARGLNIIFTNNVVRPWMRVGEEPTGSSLREIVDTILASHSLEARDGPGGAVVVIPGPLGPAGASANVLNGFIGSKPDGAPVGGAVIRALGPGTEAVSDGNGRFLLPYSGTDPLTLEVRLKGFIVVQLPNVVAGETDDLTILLDPAPILEEEVVVTPSRVSLLRDAPLARLHLDRQQILALPHLGDDLFRALTLLPGATANDVSAQFHVRGGRRDETQILLDGQELYEAYHLKDRDSALSVISPATLATADLSTGGFAAEYGDRMSGVLDMVTATPRGTRFRLGAAVFSLQAGGAGTFGEDRGSWLLDVRRGTTDLVGRLIGDEDPVYWDAFGKFAYSLGSKNSLRANFLYARDKLDFGEFVAEDEQKRFVTDYGSSYFWLTNQTFVGPRLFFETAASLTDIDRDRRGDEIDGDARFAIADIRDSEILGVRQKWSFQPNSRHSLDWGFQVRRFETEYDYFGMREFDNPLAEIRHDSTEGTTAFRGEFREDQESLHFADRLLIGDALTVQIGLRYDRHSQTDESHLSPRLNLSRAVGKGGVLRAAWGRFNQSQRPYELQVEDGETRFEPVERSEHRVLGFEKLIPRPDKESDLILRVEAYQRVVGNPRRRYENLYEPINTFPEVEPDRVRTTPDRSLAQGIEVFLRGRFGPKLGWWVNYALSSTEDRIQGEWNPRPFDQTHSLNLDLDYRISDHWRANFAWRFHTGWPTTPVSFVSSIDEDGEVVFEPILGRLNSDRLSAYHRLDFRASREWRFRSSSVSFFIDVQNAYDRSNLAGFDFELDDDAGVVRVAEEAWAGALPSAGVTIEF